MKEIGTFNIKDKYIEIEDKSNYRYIKFKGDGGPLTNEGHLKKEKYSLTHKYDADYISLYIKEKIINKLNDVVIVDGTTSLGGNFCSFVEHFNFIIGIEINQIRFQKLVKNLEYKYGFEFENKKRLLKVKNKNIILINDSFMNCLNDILKIKKKIIIFLDPPWGGKDYKLFDYVILGLHGIPMHIIVKNIKSVNKDIIIILKLPENYFLQSFNNIPFDKKKMNKFMYIIF